MTDRAAINRNNRKRGKRAENRVAEMLGTERYWANSGGALDLKPMDGIAVQVKSGKTVTTVAMRDGLAAAHAGAPPGHLAALVIEDQRARPYRRWIAFDLADWLAWNGYDREVEE